MTLYFIDGKAAVTLETIQDNNYTDNMKIYPYYAHVSAASTLESHNILINNIRVNDTQDSIEITAFNIKTNELVDTANIVCSILIFYYYE